MFRVLLIIREVVFGVNDVYDYDSDTQNPRKNKLWADGTVLNQDDSRFVILAARVSTVLVLLLALPASIQSPQVLGCTLLIVIISWIYSSPPLRLKERPVLDSLSNGVGCWSLWACGYTASGHRFLVYPAGGNFSYGGFILFCGAAVHSLGAIIDAKADAFAKQRTIATVFGERLSALFATVCL